jgi:hypothetical protein
MALIKCEECESEVSDKAIACTKCGNPILQKNQNHQTTLIEQTSKKLKLQKIIGAIIMSSGLIIGMMVNGKFGGIISVTGLVYLAVIEGIIWWKHK